MPPRSPERGSRPTLICVILLDQGLFNIPMPFAGLLEVMMAGKFEWQFKYRDEADVNARAGRGPGQFKKSLICRHFCVSSDLVYPAVFGDR